MGNGRIQCCGERKQYRNCEPLGLGQASFGEAGAAGVGSVEPLLRVSGSGDRGWHSEALALACRCTQDKELKVHLIVDFRIVFRTCPKRV